MSEPYHAVSRADRRGTLDHQQLAQVLAQDGQLLLPMLDLIESAQAAIDDLIDVMGRATIEAILLMSAQQAAGPKQQGKKTDRQVVYHGSQAGRVALKERQLRVRKPRLRKKAVQPGEPGEVEIPAYEAMQKDARLADRMLEILISGVSTRRYEHVLPAMAETVGVSKSEVSRETIEAGERLLKELAERDLSGLEFLHWPWDIIGNYSAALRVKRMAAPISVAPIPKVLSPDTNMFITDGPFLETKEHIGGFWILEAADMDEALA